MSFYEVIKKYSYEYVKDLIYNADEKYYSDLVKLSGYMHQYIFQTSAQTAVYTVVLTVKTVYRGLHYH